MLQRRISILLVLLLGCLSEGCLGLAKDFPEKQYYLLEAIRTGKKALKQADGILRVRQFRMSPVLSGTELHYRTSNETVEADFYNEFNVPPARLVTENVQIWLRDSGLFRAVIDSASPMEAKYVLEGSLTEISGDYRKSGEPKAVIRVQVFLTSSKSAEQKLLFQRDYAKRVTIDEAAPKALIRGMNSGLAEILQQLEFDLSEAIRKGSGSAGK